MCAYTLIRMHFCFPVYCSLSYAFILFYKSAKIYNIYLNIYYIFKMLAVIEQLWVGSEHVFKFRKKGYFVFWTWSIHTYLLIFVQ